MKIFKSVFAAILILCANHLIAQRYTPIMQSSTIKFKISHVMVFRSTVTGTFQGLKGTISFNLRDMSQSFFDVSVQSGTINTGINMRDNHLKQEEYFDADKYRSITIKSQSITKGTNNNSFVFLGTLTMKGVTKTITFPFTAKPVNGGYEFSSSFNLNRLEYGVGPDNSIDKNVNVDLAVFAK